jgi:RNA-directed DNA polymerase
MPVKERGLSSKATSKGSKSEEIGVNLTTPPSVQKLQTALQAKAKGSPDYRFYLLYDKLYRADILTFAYRCCRANGGAEGMDGQSFADIEAYGLERWLSELTQELRMKDYRPQAVRRVWIPKADGKQRPLGIPTVKDRVVQMAAVLVLGPIFEADLLPEQYAYRPGSGALDAVRHVFALVNNGHREVVDADLSGYFDSIPHSELLKSVSRRVSDKHVLHLIKMWLEAPVEEVDERGQKRRSTRNQDEHRGTPQGAPISPLLANLYMRRFVLGWKVLGYERRLRAYIVNYADDFVICCRGSAVPAMAAMRRMMTRLKLTVNEAKTRICRLPEESFDFLGYTIGRCYSGRTKRAYVGTRPSRKTMARLCREISDMTGRCWRWRSISEQVRLLNQKLLGWSNYFCLGSVSRAYRAVNSHARDRLRQWLRGKHQWSARGCRRYPARRLYGELGLIDLELRTRDFPWARA